MRLHQNLSMSSHTDGIRDRKSSPTHSILLVHGCLAQRAQKLGKRLRKSAASIGEKLGNQIGLCRVHVFSFDAAKLLRKGKPTLNGIVGDLLNDLKGIKVRFLP
jgi:hypothetical protein